MDRNCYRPTSCPSTKDRLEPKISWIQVFNYLSSGFLLIFGPFIAQNIIIR